jgi:hypothetical protein
VAQSGAGNYELVTPHIHNQPCLPVKDLDDAVDIIGDARRESDKIILNVHYEMLPDRHE